ncbi:helix-turn-helix transcriptional regulator [Metabacillus schmidteae]|uniref:helix-turn-helix transcriptional regulator n=1 Tax=Metabacillus schmidteae TaxID=2730405 RepID=UPI00158B9E4B|nr:response regulator transcription factor [Metabacillus schmidteae]
MKKLKGMLYQFIHFRSRSYYQKNLITLLILASLPGMIIGFVMFVISRAHIEGELKEIHENHLYSTMKTIEEQFSYVEELVAHWAVDSSFKENYQEIDLANKYKEIHELYQSLLIMEGSNHLIDRVELYINKPTPIVFTKDRYRHLVQAEQIDAFDDFVKGERTLYWRKSEDQEYSPLRLVHKIPSGIDQPYGAIIVSLNKEKMANLLRAPYEEGTAFLLTDKGQWLFGNSSRMEPEEMDQAILNEVKTHKHTTETFLFEWKQSTYSVTYETFTRLGNTWIYASAAPLSSITAPVLIVSKWMIGVSLGILFIAIILSIIVSKRLYSPLAQLLQKLNDPKYEQSHSNVCNEFELIEERWNNLSKESRALKTQLETQLPLMREGFLLQLIHGYLYSLRESDLKERMQKFGWKAEETRYLPIFIQLFGYGKLEDTKKDEEGLLTFMAANIVEEVLQEINLDSSVINFHDLSLCILLFIPKHMDKSEVTENINELNHQVISGINLTTQMDVSICIGRMTDSVKAIPNIFEETKISLSFRNLQERNQIIEIENLDLLDKSIHFEYPFDVEKEIVHAIRLRMEQDTMMHLHTFVQTLSNVNEAFMKQGMYQLLGRIVEVEMQSGLIPNTVFDGANLYEQLGQIREPDEVEGWFKHEVILPLLEQLSRKQDERMKQLIEKVTSLLQEKYMEDISLDYCADHVNLSPSILSKVFKDIVGVNFIDYLTNIRLSKAKELLVHTDMKINEIAETIGYKNSYFNRLFKKHEGYTPGQYREIRRDQAG